jgi:hypothetical protein
LKIPPRVQFFLWLLSNNKNLTRDNLAKRQQVDDKTCPFCGELESSLHLFFECVVARQMWGRISSVVGRVIGSSFESIGICWLSNKKFLNINIISSAALWALWKLRNDLCFQNKMWRSMQDLLMRVASLAQNWTILCPEEKKEELSFFFHLAVNLVGKKARSTGEQVKMSKPLCMRNWLLQIQEMEKALVQGN